MAKSKKAASGAGSIRKKAVTRNGKLYEYWEARYTVNGKRCSISAPTEKECRKKLTAALASIDDGSYVAPQKMTVEQWLNTWLDEFQNDTKTNKVGPLSRPRSENYRES